MPLSVAWNRKKGRNQKKKEKKDRPFEGPERTARDVQRVATCPSSGEGGGGGLRRHFRVKGGRNSPSFVVVELPLLDAGLVALGGALHGGGGDVLRGRGRH